MYRLVVQYKYELTKIQFFYVFQIRYIHFLNLTFLQLFLIRKGNMNMTTNNRYDIRLKDGNMPQPDAIEKIGGIASVWYDNKENNLSLTIDGKHADDAAEILQ